jgi:hypothetical protein
MWLKAREMWERPHEALRRPYEKKNIIKEIKKLVKVIEKLLLRTIFTLFALLVFLTTLGFRTTITNSSANRQLNVACI